MSKLVFDHSASKVSESVTGLTTEATHHAVTTIEQLGSISEIMEYIHLNADDPNVLRALAALYTELLALREAFATFVSL